MGIYSNKDSTNKPVYLSHVTRPVDAKGGGKKHNEAEIRDVFNNNQIDSKLSNILSLFTGSSCLSDVIDRFPG
jgi:hypothetical protein